MSETQDYDAGLLNDFGGGNVDWWWDYLRAEIGRANEHWRVQYEALSAANAQLERELNAAKARDFEHVSLVTDLAAKHGAQAGEDVWQWLGRALAQRDAAIAARVAAEGERDRLREAVEAFFAAPIPPGKHTTNSVGVAFVSLAALYVLKETLTPTTEAKS